MIGTSLNQYRITASIGAGGMGEVFRARDTRLNRDVAVKVLPKDFAADGDRLRRFEQESKTLAALNHPNVLTIHDAGLHKGAPYLVSELLEGKTLREEMNGAALSARKVTEYALQIAHGLAAAHAKGVIHRDLKPENLFVTNDGRVKILDFGLAKLCTPSMVGRESPRALPSETSESHGSTESRPTICIDATESTEPGRVMGTPSYMAPEQVRGESVDHRADIFAFGCVLYEMLSGKRPFKRDTSIATMAAIMNDEAPDLLVTKPDLPPAFARVIHRCLEKQPERRFQSASDLAFALEAAGVSNAVPRTTASGSSEQHEDPHVSPRRNQSLVTPSATRWAWVAILLVVGVGTGWWIFHQSGQATKQVANPPSASTARPASTTGEGTVAPAPQKSARQIESLAVLPLVNHSGDANQDYFADGMTDALIAELSQISSLKRVISRTTIMQFKGTRKVMSQIAKELNVDVLVEGSVQREGTRVRITAQLIDGASDRHLWATNYVREARDILTLQGEVALAIAREIKLKLSPQDQSRLAKVRPVNPEAHQAYLRGRVHWNRRTGDELKKAVDYFTLSVEKDPQFALAWAGLGSSLHLQIEYASLAADQVMPQARTAVNKALELDGSLAESHAVMGIIKLHSDWAWGEAETEYKRAIELDPNYATAHQWYFGLLRRQGRWEEAEAKIKRAMELDPLSPVINVALGDFFYFTRDLDRSIEQYRKTLELHPNFLGAHRGLGSSYMQKGMYEEAIAEFQKVRNLVANNPYGLGLLGYARAFSGRKPEALQALAQLEQFGQQGIAMAMELAYIHHGLGDKLRTLEMLEKAVEKGAWWVSDLKVDPIWESLRSEPRFIALLQKIGTNESQYRTTRAGRHSGWAVERPGISPKWFEFSKLAS